jgi:hypothetical protein
MPLLTVRLGETLHTQGVSEHDVAELQLLADELKQRLERKTSPAVWNADPEDVRRSVMQLVLTLVDFLRQVMERQAIRRMEEGSLTPEETERVGVALMKLEETVHDLARQAGLDPGDLNLDLGPLGRLK